jgi:mRNA interferase MazF
MKRGEIWTAVGGEAYAGKPRPAVIVQDDRFEGTKFVTICGLTSNPESADLFRVDVMPTELNGLQSRSRIMVDKIISVPRQRLRNKIGQLSEEEIQRVNRAILVFLGLAG